MGVRPERASRLDMNVAEAQRTRAGTDAIFAFCRLIKCAAASRTLLPLGVKVCCHGIGIRPQVQCSEVNIYGGDWREVIRSGGPFTITQWN